MSDIFHDCDENFYSSQKVQYMKSGLLLRGGGGGAFAPPPLKKIPKCSPGNSVNCCVSLYSSRYATVQGVLPGPPAKTAFQFVPTDKERRHLVSGSEVQ